MTRRHAVPSMRAALVALAFIAAHPAIAPAQGLGDCKCDDVREMRDRWCSARAARAEYERIESFLKSDSKKTGQARMFSNADKLMINQKCVQEAINSASDRGVVKATANTEENFPTQSLVGMDDCRIVVTSKEHTACLKQIVEAHETMHSAACTARKSMWENWTREVKLALQVVLYGASNTAALNVLGDSKYALTSAQFAFEEAASYAIEMQLLSAKWQELQQNCISQAFEAELTDQDTVGKQLWDNTTPDSNGKRMYKMYDLSNDPCPRRPRPPKSECTLR